MKPRAHAEFWKCYHALAPQVRRRADKQFALWLQDSGHPSLNFKKVGPDLWSARVDGAHRALARWRNGCFTWIWIGSHDEYERLITDYQ